MLSYLFSGFLGIFFPSYLMTICGKVLVVRGSVIGEAKGDLLVYQVLHATEPTQWDRRSKSSPRTLPA